MWVSVSHSIVKWPKFKIKFGCFNLDFQLKLQRYCFVDTDLAAGIRLSLQKNISKFSGPYNNYNNIQLNDLRKSRYFT